MASGDEKEKHQDRLSNQRLLRSGADVMNSLRAFEPMRVFEQVLNDADAESGDGDRQRHGRDAGCALVSNQQTRRENSDC